jgi:hypothetical protein
MVGLKNVADDSLMTNLSGSISGLQKVSKISYDSQYAYVDEWTKA